MALTQHEHFPSPYGTVEYIVGTDQPRTIGNAMIIMGQNGNVAVKTSKGVTVAAGCISARRVN